MNSKAGSRLGVIFIHSFILQTLINTLVSRAWARSAHTSSCERQPEASNHTEAERAERQEKPGSEHYGRTWWSWG